MAAIVRALLVSASLLKWLKRVLELYIAYRFIRVWFPKKVRSLNGCTVLVTGAAGGLGECICKEFARRGVRKLVLWDVNGGALATISKDLHRQRGTYPALEEVKTQQVNLALKEEIYAAAKVALESVEGRVDIVVNNAGIVSGLNFLDTPDKMNELTMSVNIMSHMYMTKAFLPSMLENISSTSACFLNIASMASYCAAAQMVDYATSKGAARSFSEGMAAELKQMGLWEKCRVSCICPGHIETKLFKGFHIMGSFTMTPEFVASMVADAYECDQELVILPRHLRPFVPLIGLCQALGSFNLPNPQPSRSALRDFDRTQADKVLKRLGA